MEVLLVEDNAGDVRLTQEAFKEGMVPVHLNTVGDGVEALEFLRRENGHSEAEQPDLILLDLNLPKKGGQEVLEEIRADDALKHIPVVVLTTSNAIEDITKMYDLHANCYITKPIGFERFIEVVESVCKFWMTTATLPSKYNEARQQQ